MPTRTRQLALNIQLGMTIFFFAGAVVGFLFLRDAPSWMARNLWWISLAVAVADLAALVLMAKRFSQISDPDTDR
jgi:hypothetical protein